LKFDRNYYESLTRNELLDVKESIDKIEYPERYQLISDVLAEKEPIFLKESIKEERAAAPKRFSEETANKISWKPVEYDFIPMTSGVINRGKSTVTFESKPLSNIFAIIPILFIFSVAILSEFDWKTQSFLIVLLFILPFIIPGIKLWSGGKLVFSKVDRTIQLKNYKYSTNDRSEIRLTPDSGLQLLSFDYSELDFFIFSHVGDMQQHFYQLNLIVDEDLRINLCTGVDGLDVLAHAKILSRELNIPLWNGIDAHKKDEEFAKRIFGKKASNKRNT